MLKVLDEANHSGMLHASDVHNGRFLVRVAFRMQWTKRQDA